MFNPNKNWVGFKKDDFDINIDLGENSDYQKITIGFLQNQHNRSFLPTRITFLKSDDSRRYDEFHTENIPTSQEDSTVKRVDITQEIPNYNNRYLRIIGKNISNCPSWHKNAGQPAYIFVDEIILE